MTDNVTIREQARGCFQLFKDCLASCIPPETRKQHDTQAVKDSIEDEFARFRLWLSNIGVFADTQLSLDFRVREIPDLRDLFLKHLDTVECRLNQRMLSPVTISSSRFPHAHHGGRQCMRDTQNSSQSHSMPRHIQKLPATLPTMNHLLALLSLQNR